MLQMCNISHNICLTIFLTYLTDCYVQLYLFLQTTEVFDNSLTENQKFHSVTLIRDDILAPACTRKCDLSEYVHVNYNATLYA